MVRPEGVWAIRGGYGADLRWATEGSDWPDRSRLCYDMLSLMPVSGGSVRRIVALVVATVAVSVLGAACGGSDTPTTEPGGSPTTTMSPSMPGMEMPGG